LFDSETFVMVRDRTNENIDFYSIYSVRWKSDNGRLYGGDRRTLINRATPSPPVWLGTLSNGNECLPAVWLIRYQSVICIFFAYNILFDHFDSLINYNFVRLCIRFYCIQCQPIVVGATKIRSLENYTVGVSTFFQSRCDHSRLIESAMPAAELYREGELPFF